MSSTVTYANGSSTAELSFSPDDEYVIHGIALGAGDITHGSSQTRKLWPPEELEAAAHTLEGQPLVKNHENTVEGKVGVVRKSSYLDGKGVIYEAVINPEYEDLARDVERGELEVSARVFHRPSEELEEDPDTGALVTEDLQFDNLSLVLTGASKSNTAEWGESAHLEEGESLEVSVEELHTEFEFEGEPVELGGNRMSRDEEELESFDYHTPNYSGTTTGEWSQPDMSDFGTEDLSEIDDHFFLSRTGFPPESYTDLSIPVVEPDGRLSLGGLRTAISGHGWQATSVDEETGQKIDSWCRSKANDDFGKDWDTDSEDSEENQEEQGDEQNEAMLLANLDDHRGDVLPDERTTHVPDDLGLVQVDINGIEIMQGKTISEVENPDDYVAVAEEDLEALTEKAGQFDALDGRLESLSGNMEDLSDTQELVEEVGRDTVESLKEYSSPVIVEESAREQEKDMVEEVGQLHADVLAQTGPFSAEELTERFSPLELREKVEDNDDLSLGLESLEEEDEEEEDEEDDEPDYKGKNPDDTDDDEELSNTNPDREEEELQVVRDRAAEQLTDMGWDGTADRVREGKIKLDDIGINVGGNN